MKHVSNGLDLDSPFMVGSDLATQFASVAATLPGVDGVRLHHDQFSWPLDADDTVTM